MAASLVGGPSASPPHPKAMGSPRGHAASPGGTAAAAKAPGWGTPWAPHKPTWWGGAMASEMANGGGGVCPAPMPNRCTFSCTTRQARVAQLAAVHWGPHMFGCQLQSKCKKGRVCAVAPRLQAHGLGRPNNSWCMLQACAKTECAKGVQQPSESASGFPTNSGTKQTLTLFLVLLPL